MIERWIRLETDIVTVVEAENRVRNLMWTVSGDYKLDTRLDVESFFRSKAISLYDAVKQGGFARYFDQNQMAMYLVKKIYYGAEEKPLTDLAQICVDAAVWKKVSKERPGVPALRKRAFEDLLEVSYEKLCGSLPGRLRAAMMQEYLDGRKIREKRLETPHGPAGRADRARSARYGAASGGPRYRRHGTEKGISISPVPLCAGEQRLLLGYAR